MAIIWTRTSHDLGQLHRHFICATEIHVVVIRKVGILIYIFTIIQIIEIDVWNVEVFAYFFEIATCTVGSGQLQSRWWIRRCDAYQFYLVLIA